MESKHQDIKNMSDANHNFKNITFSLAKYKQGRQLYYLTSPIYFKEYELGSLGKEESNFLSILSILFELPDQFDIFKWVNYYNINYNVNDIKCLKTDPNFPTFAKIRCIIRFDNEIRLIVIKLKTLSYLEYYSGFELEERNDSQPLMLNLKNLEYIFPMDLYKIENKLIIVPKYPIE